MPNTTPESYFQDYFSKNPTHTVDQAIAAYDSESRPGVLERTADAVIPMALRVGGGIGGSVVGAAGGPVGVVAGGAVGSGLGETAAEAYEVMRKQRTEMNPVQIAFQALLGAVPLGKAKNLLPGQVIRREAARGGVLGGTAAAGTELAEGRTPTMTQVAQGTILGTGLGAVGGKLASKASAPTQVRTDIPKLDALEATREAAGSATSRQNLLERISPKAFWRKYVDQFTDVRDFVRKGAKAAGLSVLPDHNPDVITDLVYGGQTGRVENAFSDFRAIREDAERRGLGPALERYLDLQFMKHGAETLEAKGVKAAVADDIALGRPTQLAQDAVNPKAGEDILAKVREGNALPQGYTPASLSADLDALKAQLGDRMPEVEGLGQKIFDLNRQALDIVHKAGIIPPKVYQELTSRPGNYGPLTRILDTVTDDLATAHASNLDLRAQKVLFNLRGSQKATRNPLTASMQRMQEAIKEAGRNEAAQTFVNLRNIHPAFAKDITPVALDAKLPKGQGKLFLYEGGEKVAYAVPEEIATAMHLADAPDVKVVGAATLSFFRNMLQRLATGANLAFSIPNVVRDVADARKLSTAYKPYNPKDFAQFAVEYAQSLKQAIAKDPEYRAFLESRAGYSTLQKTINPETFLKDATSLNPLDAVAKINSIMEETTKLTTFKRMKAQGKSDAASAIETRRFGGSPDFGRRGTASTEANLMVMFFNASVQGIDRNLRRLNPAEHPGRFALLLSGAAASALALDKWNSQFTDPDGTPSIDRVSVKDRQTSFVVIRPETYKTSEGVIRHRYYRIPKGYVARMILNPIQEAVRPSQSTGQTVANAVSGLSPVNVALDTDAPVSSVASGVAASLNPVLKAPLEQLIGAGGQDTFRGIPIVPRRLQDVEPDRQFDAGTSPTLVKATRALNAVLGPEWGRLSPKRVEAFLRSGPLVGPGEMVLGLADEGSSPLSERKLEGDEAVGKLPLVGPIARRFVGSSVDQVEANTFKDFYALRERTEEVSRTLQNIQRTAPDEAPAYADANQVMLAVAPMVRELADGFAAIRTARASQPDAAERLGAAERELLKQAADIQQLLTQLNNRQQNGQDGTPVVPPTEQSGAPQAPVSRSRVDQLWERYQGLRR